MNTEELGFRSSLLKGDPLSMLGGLTHGGLSRMREEATSADAVTQRPATGSMTSFPSQEKSLIGRSGRSPCLWCLSQRALPLTGCSSAGEGRSLTARVGVIGLLLLIINKS